MSAFQSTFDSLRGFPRRLSDAAREVRDQPHEPRGVPGQLHDLHAGEQLCVRVQQGIVVLRQVEVGLAVPAVRKGVGVDAHAHLRGRKIRARGVYLCAGEEV